MDSTKLQEIQNVKAATALSEARHQELVAYNMKVADTVLSATSALIKYMEGSVSKTEVVNQLESINTPDVEFVVKAINVLDNTLKERPVTDLSEITDVMKQVLAEAAAIPKTLPELPEQQFVDYSDQIAKLTSTVEAVTEAVKTIDTKPEAPVVNVPAPNVNVNAPDLAPLSKDLKAVEKAVKAIVIPEPVFDTKLIEKSLDKANKTLDKILSKPVGGGGGGGGTSWTSVGTNGLPQPLNLDASGNLKTTANVNLNGSDIEIGAVEIKDGTTDDRTSVINTAPTTQYGLVTRNIPSGTQTVAGTVTTGGLTDTQLRASAVPVSAAALPLPAGAATALIQTDGTQKVQDFFKTILKPYAAVLTASTTITPTTGKGIQLCWIQVVPSSDNSTANLVTIQLTISGVLTTIYNVYALGRSAVFLGDVNTNLVITLANAQPVSINIQYKEV